MAEQKESSHNPQAASQIVTRFEVSNFYRVVHADGVWGAITPQGNISMTFFSERQAYPHTVTFEVSGQVVKEVDRQVIGSILRELEVDVVMNIGMAHFLRTWLDDRIKEHEQFQLSLSSERGNEAVSEREQLEENGSKG